MKINLKLTKDIDGNVYLIDNKDEAILWITRNGRIYISQRMAIKSGDAHYYIPWLEFDIPGDEAKNV